MPVAPALWADETLRSLVNARVARAQLAPQTVVGKVGDSISV